MKKILISAKDISSNGGGERVGTNLANELCKYYDVELLSFFKENEDLHFKLNSQVKLRIFSKLKAKNALYKFFLKNIYRYFLSLKLCFFLKKNHFDFILANDGFFLPFFKNKDSKYLRLWHLQAPRKKKKIFDNFDTLIILSKKEFNTWQKYHKDIKIIPNFLNKIPQKHTDMKQKIVLSIGRMDRGDQKGFFRLLEIWQTLMQDEKLKEWSLVLVGKGILKEALIQRARDLQILDTVLFKDFKEDIEKEYLNASIYAMASHFEGFGMVLAEASSYGLACIAFDVKSGPSDIIDDNKSGFLVKDGHIQDFAKKLEILMKDEAIRENFAKKATIKSLEFEKTKIMQKWLELLS